MNSENIQQLANEFGLSLNIIFDEDIPDGSNIVFGFTNNPGLDHWVAIEQTPKSRTLID